MNIVLNGDNHPLSKETTLNELVLQLSLQGKRIAVEVNQAIVPRTNYAGFTLHQGDKVEIIHAIGGG